MIEPEKYYLFCEKWVLDSNQWSILIGAIGVFLTLIGFLIAFRLYWEQRKDNARESYEFFRSSLPQLESAIEDTIQNLEEFISKLNSDNFSNPVLSVSLNDKFLDKINLIDLTRYFKTKQNDRLLIFQKFLVDSNFFGGYHSYFTEEINYLRNNYLKKEEIYSNWQLLRSNFYLSVMADENEQVEFKNFYHNWVGNLHSDNEVFEFDDNGNPSKVNNRELLIAKHIQPLAKDIFPFIRYSKKANEINLTANKVVAAYTDIIEIRTSAKQVFEKHIPKFKEILENLKNLIK